MAFQYWYAIPGPIRKVIIGAIIYFIVSSWAVSVLGASPSTSSIIGAAAGFGTIIIAWKTPL